MPLAGTCPRYLLGTGKGESWLAYLIEGDSAVGAMGSAVVLNAGYTLGILGNCLKERCHGEKRTF